jgi:hypothetical protein
MSYDEHDAMIDAYQEQIDEENYEQAIYEFTAESLTSYYDKNPSIAEHTYKFFKKAEVLFPDHPEATFILAASAIEVGIKNIFVKPIVHGLIHNEYMAEYVTNVINYQKADPLRDLLFEILKQYGGINFKKYQRKGAKKRYLG